MRAAVRSTSEGLVTKPNSILYELSNMMRAYCTEILQRQGRDFARCEQCDGPTSGRPQLHHTRYVGATIHDLEIVCMGCNLASENRGLQ
jgi:hypothetical protein